MRRFAAIILLLGSGAPALAAGPACIPSFDIDHTEVPNNATIIFYMKDKSVYRNELTTPCPTLRTAVGGFIYQPTDPATGDLCGGMATFKVNNGTRTGPVCLFGNFTRLK